VPAGPTPASTTRDFKEGFLAGNAVEARSVSKEFGGGDEVVRALDDVSVTINQNEFFTLLGPSGCGKTTLLRLIAGFEQPSQGEILIDGQAVGHLPPFRRPVNTVFQSYALFPHLTVAENIAFGLEMRGADRATIGRRVAEMIELVKLGRLGGRRPAQLSGGQQQRVALARALANRPRVLLLDEPLSALDLKLRKEMQIELKKLQLETGITFVFVTHDQEEALTMSDRLAVMSGGKILQIGTPTAIYEHPTRRFVADFIGDTNFLPATVTGLDTGIAQVRLASGAVLPASAPSGIGVGSAVTVAVRPERVSLVPSGAGAPLAGRVETIVYFGTDTIVHLQLAEGSAFIARLQNHDGAGAPFRPGAAVGVDLSPGALQVLSD
jgi:spermidine/putrescine transport system ATP-binding protein